MIQHKLKALLVSKNLGQEALAKLIGKSREVANHKLNGRTPFTLEEAFLISEFFNKSIEEIFLNTKFTSGENKGGLTNDIKRTNNKFRKATK